MVAGANSCNGTLVLGCNWHNWSTQFFQPPDVRFEGSKEGWFEIIVQSVFPGGFLDDGCNIPIMDMANVRKQVVLNLEVKPTNIPVEEEVVSGKIRSRM